MNIKKLILGIILLVIIGIGALMYVSEDSYDVGFDSVKVNDIVQSVSKNWNTIESGTLPKIEYEYEYTILDVFENVVASTSDGITQDINTAIQNGDVIVDVIVDNRLEGKIIFYNTTLEYLQQYKHHILQITMTTMLFVFLIGLLYALYINKIIFSPFKKLQNFAHHVAAGNLDMPLEMDKNNQFGAFSESFDLMREELARARENERLATQSKKELVASLSHDIKTPVASIKAVAELMSIKANDAYSKKQLQIIGTKADQIDHLITDMFNATLEELQELTVSVSEVSSTIIYDFVKNVDYNKQVHIKEIPACIILADTLRLEQIIDNIISNSYKYANTIIDISGVIKGEYLEINFKDYGAGVSAEECLLLFQKFYRAENAKEKTGAGLGLYISKYLTTKMAGDIFCQNTKDGFIVTLQLSLA